MNQVIRVVAAIRWCLTLLADLERLRLFAGRSRIVPARLHQDDRRAAVREQTSVFDIDRRVTEKVRSELIGRGKWVVKPDATDVDGLIGRHRRSIYLAPVAFNAQQQATRYALTLAAQVEFKDVKANKVLWSNPSMQYREEFDVTTVSPGLDATAFFGQDINALERMAREFARALVSAILEAF